MFATQYLADCSEDEPIKLSGVSSVDLDRFLSLMYPRYAAFQDCPYSLSLTFARQRTRHLRAVYRQRVDLRPSPRA